MSTPCVASAGGSSMLLAPSTIPTTASPPWIGACASRAGTGSINAFTWCRTPSIQPEVSRGSNGTGSPLPAVRTQPADSVAMQHVSEDAASRNSAGRKLSRGCSSSLYMDGWAPSARKLQQRCSSSVSASATAATSRSAPQSTSSCCCGPGHSLASPAKLVSAVQLSAASLEPLAGTASWPKVAHPAVSGRQSEMAGRGTHK
mmetsp:Transcript_39914/g.114009  ORF Transcript_39914/g.114009 Transcript_39914/m.114009 type:complete len:202 (-) Transcript_39914:709-1314(-)